MKCNCELNIDEPCECGDCEKCLEEEEIKEAIEELISKGEVLKNGAFVINYKEMLEILGAN